MYVAGLGVLEGRENPFEETVSKGPKAFGVGIVILEYLLSSVLTIHACSWFQFHQKMSQKLF